jgi:hypothetical protein
VWLSQFREWPLCISPELHARSACVGRQTSTDVPHVGQPSDPVERQNLGTGKRMMKTRRGERRSELARVEPEIGAIRRPCVSPESLSRALREALRRAQGRRGRAAGTSMCVGDGASRWAWCGELASPGAGASAAEGRDGQDRGRDDG